MPKVHWEFRQSLSSCWAHGLHTSTCMISMGLGVNRERRTWVTERRDPSWRRVENDFQTTVLVLIRRLADRPLPLQPLGSYTLWLLMFPLGARMQFLFSFKVFHEFCGWKLLQRATAISLEREREGSDGEIRSPWGVSTLWDVFELEILMWVWCSRQKIEFPVFLIVIRLLWRLFVSPMALGVVWGLFPGDVLKSVLLKIQHNSLKWSRLQVQCCSWTLSRC